MTQVATTKLDTIISERPVLEYTDELAAEMAPLYDKISSVVPSVEWPFFAPYIHEINRLKKERNAVILAHNYQTPEIFHTVADFVGDSLALAREATKVDADIIVQCGVHFMAETSKLLNPEKTILIPDMKAGCSLAESITGEDVRRLKAEHPGAPVVTYVNTSADVKAETDICCTSGNAVEVVRSLGVDKVIFIPDEYLAANVARETDVEMVTWKGSCIVHERFSEKELIKLKAEYPDAPVTAHPECPEHILRHADHVGSTSSILKFVLDNPSEEFLVATEPGILHQMQKNAPNKTFIGAPGADGNCNCNQCPYMALNTIEKLYNCLNTLGPEIDVDEITRIKAKAPLDKMLEMSPAQAPTPPKSGRAF